MSNKTCLLALIGLVLIASSLSQDCFTKKFENARALKGDTIAVDLDNYSKGNNIKFQITSTEDGTRTHTLKKTFDRQVSTSDLSSVAENCTYVAEGPVTGEMFLICDKIKIVKAVLNKASGEITSMTSTSVDASWDCKAIQIASESSVGYALCVDGTNFQILKFSTVKFEDPQNTPFKITQTQVAERIGGDQIKFVLDEGKKAGDSNNYFYIHEFNSAGVELRFRAIRETAEGKLSSLGFFDLQAEKIQGVEKTTSKKLHGFLPNGENIFMTLKEETTEDPKVTRNLIYNCKRNFTSSKLNCTANTFVLDGNGLIKLGKPSKDSKMVEFFHVSSTEVTGFGINPTDMEKYEILKQNIEGHKLKSVSDFWMSGKNYYITGIQDVEGVDRPSILKINTKNNSYEEHTEYSLAPGISYVREDFYDNEYGLWFNFSG